MGSSVKDEQAAIKGIGASGKSTIDRPTAEEKAMWVKAMLPVRDEMASRVEKATIEMMRSAVAAPASK